MKTIEYKGKAYITVNERLKEFRNTFKGYSLITEIIELGNDYATVKASVIDDKGTLRATGFAREVVAKSPTNKFAFLENCETSAIGRALGNFGIGIDTAVCTADELIMKLSQSGELAKDEIEVKEEVAPEETEEEIEQEVLTAIAKCGDVEGVRVICRRTLPTLKAAQRDNLIAICKDRAAEIKANANS